MEQPFLKTGITHGSLFVGTTAVSVSLSCLHLAGYVAAPYQNHLLVGGVSFWQRASTLKQAVLPPLYLIFSPF